MTNPSDIPPVPPDPTAPPPVIQGQPGPGPSMPEIVGPTELSPTTYLPSAPYPPYPPPAEFSVGSAPVPQPPTFTAPDPGYNVQTPEYYGNAQYSVPALPPGGYQPYGMPATSSGYGAYAPVGYPAYPAPARTNGLSVASMVTSIVGMVFLICWGIGGLFGLVGAILGHISRRQIRERAEGGGGMALTGIILGWISLGLAVSFVALLIVLYFIGRTATSNLDSGYYNMIHFLLAYLG
jgi:hypothetical protein